MRNPRFTPTITGRTMYSFHTHSKGWFSPIQGNALLSSSAFLTLTCPNPLLHNSRMGSPATTVPLSAVAWLLAAALIGFVVACDTIPAADTESEIEETVSSAPTPKPQIGSPDAPGSSIEARTEHTATLMPDGTILAVAGAGDDDELTSAEYYDPSTGLWTLVGPISEARAGHTATLLADGRVLIVAGGGGVGSVTPTTELYDPRLGVLDGSLRRSASRASTTPRRCCAMGACTRRWRL